MRGIKKGLLAGVVLLCMPVMTACSFKDTLEVLWNSEDKTSEESDEKTETKLEAANVNEQVEAPTITNTFGEPVTYGLNGEAQPIAVEASVTGGGTLSYQWYRNNVDSNGGGTEIAGAVENSYTPSTSEPGTSYYYVVVTNTAGDGIQMATSTTKCVVVTEESAVTEAPSPTEAPASPEEQGKWVQDEQGKRFMNADGTYITYKWKVIQNEIYIFDENGYVRTGWYQQGDKWYFLNEDGILLHDTVIDGYQLGSDGARQ